MNEALLDLRGLVDKAIGAGHARVLNSAELVPVEYVTSGSLGLDINTLGFARGKITYIKGWEGSGKSSLMLAALAKESYLGPVAIIDLEHALYDEYLEAIGVNLDNCILVQPQSIDDGKRAFMALVNSGEIRAIGFDSIAALATDKENKSDDTAENVGVKAKFMNRFMREAIPAVSNNEVVAILINQLREKPGVVYGSPVTDPAGNAMKFAAFIILECKRGPHIKDGTELIGHNIKIKCEKSKSLGPFAAIEVPFIYGKGVDFDMEVVRIGAEFDIIDKKASWYSYQDAKIGQGEKNTAQFLADNPELRDEIVTKIRAVYTKQNAVAEDE